MNKIALIVGINSYEHFTTLDNCINDAKDINKFFSGIGFNTTLLLNPEKKDLDNEIKVYKESIKDGTTAIFYFSGHGLQLEHYNFLVSRDSDIKSIHDIPYNSTNISEIFSDISTEIDFTHIVILDACRKNPFSTGLGKVGANLQLEKPRKGTLIAYAASVGCASIERAEDKNGLYTKHLLANLSLTNVNIEQVFKNTRTLLLNDTENKQLSWEESSLHEEMFLIKEDVEVLEFQEIVNEYVNANNNLLLQTVHPFLHPKYFHSLSLEHLHLALTLIEMGFEDEQNEKVTKTLEFDYLNDELLNIHLPLFQTRIINEDVCENKFEEKFFDEIKLINDCNYGFNEVITADEAFPHFMINHITYNGKEGLFSVFLSVENGEHFIKPILFLKANPLEILCFKTLLGKEALKFFEKFVEIREPFEKKTTNGMDIFSQNEGEISFEDLLDHFKEED